MDYLRTLFVHFTENEWIFEGRQIKKIVRMMSKEDQAEFPFDPSLMDWKKYLYLYIYGLQKFIQK